MMLTHGVFPSVLNETHWFILNRSDDVTGECGTLVDFCTTDAAQAQREYAALLAHGADVELIRCDTVYLPRCVICGEFAAGQSWKHRSWNDLVDDVTGYPGWTTHPEQLVFCPFHRPREEY